MYRRLSLLTFFLIFTLSIISCESASTEPTHAKPKPNDEHRDNLQPVVINFHAPTPNPQKIEKVIEAFESRYNDIKVNFIHLKENRPEDQMKKIDILAASGEDLDVFLLADARSFSQRVAAGMIAPLNAYLEKEGVDFESEYKTNTVIDGNYYALPGNLKQWFVVLNKEQLDEANLQVPKEWTWDDYMEYAKALTYREEPDKHYGSYFHTWPDYLMLALWNQPDHNDIVLADGTINMDHPGVRKSLEIRYQMEHVDQSVVPYTDVVTEDLIYTKEYLSGNVSMLPIGSFMLNVVGGDDVFNATFETAFAPIPKNNEKDEGMYSMVSSNYLVLSSTSKHKEEAYTFMRFYTTEGISSIKQELSSWKNQDIEATIDTIIGSAQNPEFINRDSLLYVLKNSQETRHEIPPPYIAEVYKVFQEEVEWMLLGEQDIDTTLKKARDQVERVVSANE